MAELQREAEVTLTGLMGGETKPAATPPGPAETGMVLEQFTALPGVGEKLAGRLVAAGFAGLTALADATPEALQAIEGIGPKSAERILLAVREALANPSGVAPAPEEPAAAENAVVQAE